MPLLGRFFTRKNKNSPRGISCDDTLASSTLGSPTALSDSNHSSHTTSSYVTPDISTPSDPNLVSRELGPATGGSRLRLFNRKKSNIAGTENAPNPTSEVRVNGGYIALQRTAFPRLSDVDTDPSDLRRLRPPPSRSAIFAAYADPGSSLSTRSLPENSFQKTNSSPSSSSPSPDLPQKRPSFFAWAKPSSSSSLKSAKTNDDPFNTQSDSSDSRIDTSFTLKSFKHIRPPSPPLPTASGTTDGALVPPMPRPRGSSMHSDTSQRISVAAFREVQARRSQAGSPVPSPRGSSPVPAQGAITPEGSRIVGRGPRLSRSSAALLQHDPTKRPSTAVASGTDEDDSSGDSSDEDTIHRRGNNGPRPGKSKAKSETGHGSTSTFKKLNPEPPLPRASRSHVGHTPNSRPLSHLEPKDELVKPIIHPRSQSSLGIRRGTNASASTVNSATATTTVTHHQSASSPANVRNHTPRKVSPLQSAGNQQRKPAIHPLPRDASDSDDDAPLATLVAPRRPGSAMSSYSNPRSASGHSQIAARSQTHSKPLIDVTELITSKPLSVASPPSDAGFTQGPTLLSCGKSATTTTYGTLQVVESPKMGESKSLTRAVSPGKLLSPPASPAEEMKMSLGQTPDGTRNLDSPRSPSQHALQSTEVSPGPQKRDPLPDRLSRAVKKSLTNPLPSTATSATKTKSLSRETSPTPGVASSESLQTPLSSDASRIVLPRNLALVTQPSPAEYSPPDEDLAKLLGTAGIKFISRSGESPEESSESESSEEEKDKDKDKIAPILIQRRSPPPAFTVTSRPPLSKQQEQRANDIPSRPQSPQQTETKEAQSPATHPNERQQNPASTPFPASPSFPPSNVAGKNSTALKHLTLARTDASNKSGKSHTQGRIVTPSNLSTVEQTASIQSAFPTRQRSTTMLPSVPPHVQETFNVLDRDLVNVRGNSPSSSTGDSSSGHTPHTPQDGSDLGVQDDGIRKSPANPKDRNETSTTSSLGIKRQNAHSKRRSVSFDDNLHEMTTRPSRSHIREGAGVGSEALGARRGSHLREGAGITLDTGDLDDEEKEARRKERRRKEAKNAIELGNIIHGPPPVLDDDNNDMPTNQNANPRLSSFNPLMGMASPMALPMGFVPTAPVGWGSGMLSPAQFMIPRPSDPNLLAAHQQAMMYAKQAYQMAVAQHAMAAAGEEWERGSALGGFGGTGSVYGGSTAPIMNPLGMMQSMGMMGVTTSAGWSSSSLYGGMGAVPRFGSQLNPGDTMISSSRSDYGGAPSGSRSHANWSSSRSVYGESLSLANASSERSTRRSGPQQHLATLESQRNSWRDSGTFPPVPHIPASQNMNGRANPEFRGPTRLRTSSQPATPTRTNVMSRRPPPSSWRLAGT